MTLSSRPAPVEAAQAQWDRVAGGWKTWWPTIEVAAQGVSERLLALAGVVPGQRVLDLATGIGEPALLAARRIGTDGTVVASDISSAMLDIARERATRMGIAQVSFLQADATRLPFVDGSFDAVLCRWGVMSLPEPPRVLAGIRRLLSPGGAFATAIWVEGERGRPLACLAEALSREMSGEPQATPAAVRPGSSRQALLDALAGAGFEAVRTGTLALTLTWDSADACARDLLDVSPDLARQPLARATPGIPAGAGGTARALGGGRRSRARSQPHDLRGRANPAPVDAVTCLPPRMGGRAFRAVEPGGRARHRPPGSRRSRVPADRG